MPWYKRWVWYAAMPFLFAYYLAFPRRPKQAREPEPQVLERGDVLATDDGAMVVIGADGDTVWCRRAPVQGHRPGPFKLDGRVYALPHNLASAGKIQGVQVDSCEVPS